MDHQYVDTTYSLDTVEYVPLMFQTGYYTLRQDTDGDLYLDYPNDEVRQTYRRPPDPRTLQAMHRALADENWQGFCDLFHTFLTAIPGEKLRRETDCHLVLHVLCPLMQVAFQSEVHQGGGRSDMEVLFSEHVCVMEFKYGESTDAALNQIRSYDYGRRHFGGTRKVVALDLNFVPSTEADPFAIEYAACVRSQPD